MDGDLMGAVEIKHAVAVSASPMTLKLVREFVALTKDFGDETIVTGASKLEAIYGNMTGR